MGVPLAAGTTITAFAASANRDPAYLDRADEFLIDRNVRDSRLPSFGAGPHYCVGARLATLELEIAPSTFIERLPHLTLTNVDTLQWHDTFPGVKSLMAAWRTLKTTRRDPIPIGSSWLMAVAMHVHHESTSGVRAYGLAGDCSRGGCLRVQPL